MAEISNPKRFFQMLEAFSPVCVAVEGRVMEAVRIDLRGQADPAAKYQALNIMRTLVLSSPKGGAVSQLVDPI